ncbi:MAG: dihydrolipoamide acetyltransferase family protein [Planctomycetota bacterium]|jgi:pyruvate dehydrogenase E2 component (dihydrolipoamide acetyltransferase)|nr:dihydrolipoamide acetyltransferase family protein [Planctomycetota bacterium]MDP6940849.1 dihydrolipoamide acetyltransferase family protein [Planctomycetota bacterium]
MATLEFKLPDIGEGVHEGEIVRWIADEGASVSEDDPIVEVMTDKATVEIPSPMTGVVSKQLVNEGDVAKVGDVIFVIEGEGGGGAEAPSAPLPELAPASVDSPPPKPQSKRVLSGEKVLAAPATRRLAREMGIDLSAVVGTGKNGRIRPSDVRGTNPSETPSAEPIPSFAPASSREVEQIPFRGVRRKTAEAMSRSKFTATHFSLIEEVDCTAMGEARAKAKEVGARHGVKVTWMPYIMKATALALMEFPQLNAELDESAGVILQKKYVNLGIAVDTPNGLMVPVVQDCHLKGLLQLSTELLDVATRAREGKVTPADFADSTFTISNAGNIGGVMATPIINFPEVAIMGVHTMRKMPRCVGDDIVARMVMNLSISIDHRVVDGADGARFMVRVRELLEDPSLMLL